MFSVYHFLTVTTRSGQVLMISRFSFQHFQMSRIRTLVYIDIEATGLRSSGKPRITELSLVAVKVEDVLELQKTIIQHLDEVGFSGVEKLEPRVLNKLTICVYPMATIMPVVSNITGLDNYNLSDQARFDKNTVDMINSFLLRLPSPVCLVAHNGDNFDFPLLKAELEKVKGSLGTDILCADSYNGFQHIFRIRREKMECEKQAVEEKLVDKEVKAVTELLATGEFEAEMDRPPETQPTPRKRSGEEILQYFKISKTENKSTPSKHNISMNQSNYSKLKLVRC